MNIHNKLKQISIFLFTIIFITNFITIDTFAMGVSSRSGGYSSSRSSSSSSSSRSSSYSRSSSSSSTRSSSRPSSDKSTIIKPSVKSSTTNKTSSPSSSISNSSTKQSDSPINSSSTKNTIPKSNSNNMNSMIIPFLFYNGEHNRDNTIKNKYSENFLKEYKKYSENFLKEYKKYNKKSKVTSIPISVYDDFSGKITNSTIKKDYAYKIYKKSIKDKVNIYFYSVNKIDTTSIDKINKKYYFLSKSNFAKNKVKIYVLDINTKTLNVYENNILNLTSTQTLTSNKLISESLTK